METVVLFLSILLLSSASNSSQTNNTVEHQNSSVSTETLPWFIQKIVFFPISRAYVFWSRDDLAEPSSYGLDNVEHFYIPVGDERLGAWYIWPQMNGSSMIGSIPYNSTLIIYMHGNSRDRGHRHRVALYKVLQSLDCHILTFDYRGFGDSSPIHLSEASTVKDAVAVLRWVDGLYEGDRPHVVVWGHSLGTAIATQAVAKLQVVDGDDVANGNDMMDRALLEDDNNRVDGVVLEDGNNIVDGVMLENGNNLVDGLVLEAPFTTMEDEVRSFKVARFTAFMMQVDIPSELSKAGVEFRAQDYLPNISAPTLILHAADDYIVPLRLGVKLFNNTVDAGKTNVAMVSFSRDHRLRHRNIYRAPGIELYINKFLGRARDFRRKAQDEANNGYTFIEV